MRKRAIKFILLPENKVEVFGTYEGGDGTLNGVIYPSQTGQLENCITEVFNNDALTVKHSYILFKKID